MRCSSSWSGRRRRRGRAGGVLFQHLHAAVAGDAVADVDDQVALGQVEKAVDGPRLEPAARRAEARRWAAHRGGTVPARPARPRLPGLTSRKPARTRPMTRRSRSVCASWPAASTSPRRLHSAVVVAGDHDALAGRHGVQLVAHPGHVAAETLHRLDTQPERRLHRRAGQRRPFTLGKRSSRANTSETVNRPCGSVIRSR